MAGDNVLTDRLVLLGADERFALVTQDLQKLDMLEWVITNRESLAPHAHFAIG